MVTVVELGDVFATLPRDVRERIAAAAIPCRFKAKQALFRAGTAREVVVRAIAALVRADGIRRVGRSRFAVVNRNVLESIAGQ
jgi:hypothetical protein